MVTTCVSRVARSSGVAALRLMTHLARAEDDDGVKGPLEAFETASKDRGPLAASFFERMKKLLG